MSKQKQQTVLICGASGRMGQELCRLVGEHSKLHLGATVDHRGIRAFDRGHSAVLKYSQKAFNAVLAGADIAIDFSSPAGTKMLLEGLRQTAGKSVLVGTTGLPEKIKTELKRAAKSGEHRLLIAGNTSLGVATVAKLSVQAAQMLAPAGFDIEITETHHRMKTDSPSGTALLLADVLKKSVHGSSIVLNRSGPRKANSIGIHSVRGGGVFGEHEIRFISDHEEVKISHRAFSRALFANGAINLVLSLNAKIKPGQAIEMADFILSK